MDPHPTPFPGKRRQVAAAAPSGLKAAAPKPKSIATTRAARMAKRSPTGNANVAPQPRPPRRAFGTTRSNNAPVEKPPPPLQKPSKVSSQPLKKPSKMSPPAMQKPSKMSPPATQKPSKMSPPATQKPSKLPPPAIQKASKLSPPAMQKPLKLSPPNPIRAKPSRLVAKPLKKVAPGADLEAAKIKKKSQRVSFQEIDVVAAAPRSGEKAKDYVDDAVGHTPMVAIRATEKPAKVLAAETPFFSAQNCSNCTLDQLESATYWLAQIRLAESVGKHSVAAAFFRLAFECQSQPIHRIQSELRSYTVRHKSAGTFTPLFDELLTAHGMPVNQPKFDTDGCDKLDTPLATNAVEKDLDTAILEVDECLEFECGGDLIDVGAIIVDKHDEDANVIDQPSFQKKLDESFEFDDSDAATVDQVDKVNFDQLKSIVKELPFCNEIVQLACRSSTEKLSSRGAAVVLDSSSACLSLDNPSDKLSPSTGSSSSRRLSSGSSFDIKSPLLSKRLISSCPPCNKSATRDLSSKRMPSGSHSDGKHSAAAHQRSEVSQDVASECPALFDQLESKGSVDDAASNED